MLRTSLGRFTAAVTIAALGSTVGASPSAQAEDPPFVGWSAILPPLVYQYNPDSVDDCVAGRVACVSRTITTMQRRYRPLAKRCDHDAVFAMTYLRTTQAYLTYTRKPGFFIDAAFVNHQDAAFARMYFNAYDAWANRRVERVPPAWRTAFDSADHRQVTGMGDLLLGMNAHVQRDLPFLLAELGLVTPTGESRKPDHDKVNRILNHVIEPLLMEAQARFDPDILTMQTPYGVGYAGLLQTLVAWRETAWRNAELLAAAPTPAAKETVAQTIETYAASQALAIKAGSSYLPPVTTTASRDAYCAAQLEGR